MVFDKQLIGKLVEPNYKKSIQLSDNILMCKTAQHKNFSMITFCCDKNCHLQFSTNLQGILFEKFYNAANLSKQAEFLYFHIEVTPVARHYTVQNIKQRNNTRRYYLPDERGQNIPVCKSFFKSVLKVSDGMIDRVLRKERARTATDTCNENITDLVAPESNVQEIANAISKLPSYEIFVLNQKDSNILSGISPIDIKLLYKEYCQLQLSENVVSKLIFASIIEGIFAQSNSPNEKEFTENVPGTELLSSSEDPSTESVNEEGKQNIATNVSAKKTLECLDVKESGKIIPRKEFSITNHCCNQKCYINFSENNQQDIFNKFYLIGHYNDQNAFIFNNIHVTSVARHYKSKHLKQKNRTRKFFLPVSDSEHTSVCKYFFRSVLAISDGRIDRVLKGSKPPSDKRGRHLPSNKTAEDKVQVVLNAIETFSNEMSFQTKTKSFNVRAMYKRYCKDNAQPVSESVFRSIFNSKIK